MQVFEFHFNPKTKKDLIFDSFCYEPENVFEKRKGSLYMLGFLKNVLPQNLRFLDNLAKIIKEKYYKSIPANPEKSLKETLKKANEFLEKIAKEGDVSWLGNLNFAALSLKNFELNFTKVGDLKIFLLRKGQIIDIEEKLRFEDIEPYPLKIFGNIVSGKLAKNDIVLALTKEVATTFFQENLLGEIANLSPFEQRKLKEVLNAKKEQLSKISGVCLLIVLSKEILLPEKETLTRQKPLRVFSFKEIFTPLIKLFKFPKISFKKPNLYKKIKLPQVKFKLANRRTILILVLILFLALGFFIFEREERKELKIYQSQLNQIQEKVNQAENYLIIAEGNPQAEKKANTLFKESWQELSPLVSLASTFPSDFTNQVLTLKENISENLYQLNKLKIIEKPQLIFEFNPREFIPQRIIFHSENLYFFSPYSKNLFKVNKEAQGKVIETNQKFNLAAVLDDSILFFSKPNQLINFQEDNFSQSISLKTPYPDFSFNNLSSYHANLYFLDRENGKIIKYPHLKNLQWGPPQLWLENKKAKDFKSMTIDGSIWVLTKNNSIERYYAGNLQETLEMEIFPSPKVFSKIFTSPQLSYLYILEPVQKRIIILSKSGKIIKQFQSEKFDSLLDFAVSKDGKTIYLLNGLKVYKILF